MGITEQGAEHSAEHGAVDDDDAVRKQQATIAVWRLLKDNDTVLLRCVVSFL
jgi:predicted DCC family thiol-disulfide oxidoreductase YuxK